MLEAPKTTRIYVDADACPVKDEIYRVAIRLGVPVSVVAGQFIRVNAPVPATSSSPRIFRWRAAVSKPARK
jgi:uncharacterized protein YaiI (UPF0178 family)